MFFTLMNYSNIISICIDNLVEISRTVDSYPHGGGINSDCCHRSRLR